MVRLPLQCVRVAVIPLAQGWRYLCFTALLYTSNRETFQPQISQPFALKQKGSTSAVRATFVLGGKDGIFFIHSTIARCGHKYVQP